MALLFPSITRFVCTFIPSSLHKGENIHHLYICQLSRGCQHGDSQHDKTVVALRQLWGSELRLNSTESKNKRKKIEVDLAMESREKNKELHFGRREEGREEKTESSKVRGEEVVAWGLFSRGADTTERN